MAAASIANLTALTTPKGDLPRFISSREMRLCFVEEERADEVVDRGVLLGVDFLREVDAREFDFDELADARVLAGVSMICSAVLSGCISSPSGTL